MYTCYYLRVITLCTVLSPITMQLHSLPPSPLQELSPSPPPTDPKPPDGNSNFASTTVFYMDTILVVFCSVVASYIV